MDIQRNLTIKDFAERIGLSTASISRAFTPGSSISEATREKILTEAHILGYVPNQTARRLAQRHSKLIGLDYPGNADVLADPYLVELARGVQDAAQIAGYGLLLNTLPRPGGDDEILREWILGKAVDGVVIVVPLGFPVDSLKYFASRDIPCILITQMSSPGATVFPSIQLDLEKGAISALTHLIRLGHDKIGYITSNTCDSVHRVYLEMMRETGFLDTSLIVETESTTGGGRTAMHRLLAARIHPTAVFCRTDIIALGALRAVKEMRLRVPEDISIIGHDDLLLAELSDPALSTVRIDTAKIGRLATEQLIKRFQAKAEGTHPISHTTSTCVGTELIIRSSTGPAIASSAVQHIRRHEPMPVSVL